MATVRMQFDHEDDDDDYPNRNDNNRLDITPARAAAPAAAPVAAVDDDDEDSSDGSYDSDIVLRETAFGMNEGDGITRRTTSSGSTSQACVAHKKSGTDWVHALEAGNFVSKHDKDEYRDISSKANWTLSSCKVDGDGFGVNELLSDSVDSYWQSDGPQPHQITVEFPRKTDISFLALYLDFKSDESYTPNKLCVRLGSSLMHLDEEFEQSFNEPVGWQIMDLRRGLHAKRAFVLQLQVVANHQNGRDTHIRHMRVIGPVQSRFNTVTRALVTPQWMSAESSEFGDENGDPVFRPPPPRDAPLLPMTTVAGKLRSMIIR